MVISLSLWPTRRRSNKTGSRTAPKPFLNDSQWKLIEDLFPEPEMTSCGGRPPIPPRPCLEGILWILRTGARWQAPFHDEQGPRTIPQRPNLLATAQAMDRVRPVSRSLDPIARDARRVSRHRLGRGDRRRDVFASKKRGASVGDTKKGKGTKLMIMIDGNGTPLSIDVTGANHAEVKLIEPLIEKRALEKKPARLMYDRAADSDPLRARLAARQIELIRHHRGNRTKPATQVGWTGGASLSRGAKY